MSDKDPLRGVPFRLSKKFYPLIRPQLRDIDIHIPLEALEDDYDFTFERQMITRYEQFEEERERLRIETEEKLAQDRKRLEEAIRLQAEERRKLEEAIHRQQVIQAEETRKLVQARREADIEAERRKLALEENRRETEAEKRKSEEVCSEAEPEGKEKFHQEATAPKNESTPVPFHSFTRVSLSEFETDTENPFDSTELKSMNDKAELATIWSKVIQEQQNHVAKLSISPTPIAANQSNELLVNGQVTPNIPAPISTASPVSSSLSNNSFTSLHFPFLSNYARTGTRSREQDRAMERSYYQQNHQHQTQSQPQNISQQNSSQSQHHFPQHQNFHLSSSAGPPPVGTSFVGGFNSAGMLSSMVPHLQPSLSTSSPANIPNRFPNPTNNYYNNSTNL